MGVTVKTTVGNDRDYEQGSIIEVSDGHLHVKQAKTSSGGAFSLKTIGIHAPGTWSSAHVE